MAFDHGANIPCAQALVGHIVQQYNVREECKVCHKHLEWSVRIQGQQSWDLCACVNLPNSTDRQGESHGCLKDHADFLAHSIIG